MPFFYLILALSLNKAIPPNDIVATRWYLFAFSQVPRVLAPLLPGLDYIAPAGLVIILLIQSVSINAGNLMPVLWVSRLAKVR